MSAAGSASRPEGFGRRGYYSAGAITVRCGEAQATFPVRNDAAPNTAQADGRTLQIADQHSDRVYQHQPINSLGSAQPTAP